MLATGQNKTLIVSLGGLTPLIRQMNSPNVEVQCNAVGCITNLATHEENKARIARSGALAPLTRLAKSKDMRVQRNATGALLNMTHSDDNRQQLVSAGAIPVLVSLLSSTDTDVQYYCTTALSNIAVDSTNRKRLAQTETKLVQSLVHLMKGQAPKVQCQAALALRNLASDEKYQLEIVRAGGLPPLLQLLQSSYLPLILSAVACIRNISIHPMNESPIIDAGFLKPLVDLLGSTDNEEIQCHAISTLRNLAASSDRNKQLVLQAGAVQKCKELVLEVPLSVQSEMTAAIAVLALSDDLKPQLLDLGVFDVLIPLTESESIEVQGNSAAALGNLSSKGRVPNFTGRLSLLTFHSRRLFALPHVLEPAIWRHSWVPEPISGLWRPHLSTHRHLDITSIARVRRPEADRSHHQIRRRYEHGPRNKREECRVRR